MITESGKLRIGPWFLFGALLTWQITMVYTTPWSDSLVGDEFYYVGKARQVVEHGWFLPLTTEQKEIISGKRRGNSDYRPPGYPLFLVLCSGGTIDNVAKLRFRCASLHTLLLSIMLVVIFGSLAKSMKETTQYLWAALVGLQPWVFGYVKLLGPESLFTFLVITGIFCLGASIASGSRQWIWTLSAMSGLAFGFGITMRPEVLALSILMVLVAVGLKWWWGEQLNRTGFVILFLLVGAGIGVNAVNRVIIGDDLKWSGTWRYDLQGAAKWSETWLNGHKQRLGIAWDLDEGYELKLSDLPERAIGDAWEREQLEKALHQIKSSGYDDDVDKIFNNVAEKRIKDSPLWNYYIPKIWYGVEVWINTETSNILLNTLVPVPRWARIPVVAGFLLLKALLFVLFLSSLWLLTRRLGRGHTEWQDGMGGLFAALVLGHTLLVFMVNVFVAGFAVNDPRYMIVAWPALIWCAGYYLAMKNSRGELLGAPPSRSR